MPHPQSFAMLSKSQLPEWVFLSRGEAEFRKDFIAQPKKYIQIFDQIQKLWYRWVGSGCAVRAEVDGVFQSVKAKVISLNAGLVDKDQGITHALQGIHLLLENSTHEDKHYCKLHTHCTDKAFYLIQQVVSGNHNILDDSKSEKAPSRLNYSEKVVATNGETFEAFHWDMAADGYSNTVS